MNIIISSISSLLFGIRLICFLLIEETEKQEVMIISWTAVKKLIKSLTYSRPIYLISPPDGVYFFRKKIQILLILLRFFVWQCDRNTNLWTSFRTYRTLLLFPLSPILHEFVVSAVNNSSTSICQCHSNWRKHNNAVIFSKFLGLAAFVCSVSTSAAEHICPVRSQEPHRIVHPWPSAVETSKWSFKVTC